MRALLTVAENQQGEMMIILGGYKNKLDDLIAFDPGLKRRFPPDNMIDFPDYTQQQLLQIMRLELLKRKLKAKEPKWLRVLSKRIHRGAGQPGFGNAGTAINEVDRVVKRQSARLTVLRRALARNGGGAELSDADLFQLTKEDILGAVACFATPLFPLPCSFSACGIVAPRLWR